MQQMQAQYIQRLERKLLTISFLFVYLSGFGQSVGVNNGKVITHDGKIRLIQPGNIPPNSQGGNGNGDTAMSAVVWNEDWEDFNLIDSGIHTDTLALYIDDYDFMDYEGTQPYADEAGIVNSGGSQVLRSYYDEGMCCLEGDDEAWNEGTGLGIYMDVEDGAEWWVSFWMKYSDPFEMISYAGHKLLIIGRCDFKAGDMYLAIHDYVAQSIMTSIQFSYYCYTSGPPYTTPVSVSWMCEDSVQQDVWTNLTARFVHSSDTDEADGRMDVFINGIYTGYSRTGLVLASSYPDPDDPTTFDEFNISTFMGGNTLADYASPIDQYMDMDDVVLWYPKPGISGIPYGSDAPSESLDITDIMPDECRIDAH